MNEDVLRLANQLERLGLNVSIRQLEALFHGRNHVLAMKQFLSPGNKEPDIVHYSLEYRESARGKILHNYCAEMTRNTLQGERYVVMNFMMEYDETAADKAYKALRNLYEFKYHSRLLQPLKVRQRKNKRNGGSHKK